MLGIEPAFRHVDARELEPRRAGRVPAFVEPALAHRRAAIVLDEQHRRAARAIAIVHDERRGQGALPLGRQAGVRRFVEVGRRAIGEQREQRLRLDAVVCDQFRQPCARAQQLWPWRIEPVIAEPVDAAREWFRFEPVPVRVVVERAWPAEQHVESGVARRASRRSSRYSFGDVAPDRKRVTRSPRDGAPSAGRSSSRKLVTMPNRPERAAPIHVPAPRRSRPASMRGSSGHQPSGAVGRS